MIPGMDLGGDQLKKAVDKLFAGTNLHRDKIETLTILKEVAEGAESEEEAEEYVRDICKSVSVLLKTYGKDVKPEECFDQIMEAIRVEMAKKMYIRNLAKLRRRRRGGI